MGEESLCRAIEHAVREFADHIADSLVLGVRRAIHKRAGSAALCQIALGFDDFHHSHHRGISDFAALQEGFVNIAESDGLALTHQLHDSEFLRSERDLPRLHTYELYSTIYFVCQ
jgi:hypothetical protein